MSIHGLMGMRAMAKVTKKCSTHKGVFSRLKASICAHLMIYCLPLWKKENER